ncbi:MAG TPA: RsmD family RNA methyltransferase, partial [Coriobacteriia bacterium]
MRIVAGSWRGRRLIAPGGRATRPTSDRVREALFDALVARLGADLGGAAVLDLYAGTGALGLEALSRGATRAVFVENDRAALRALADNVSALGAQAECVVVAGDVGGPALDRALSHGP